jgi:hypothetical protein
VQDRDAARNKYTSFLTTITCPCLAGIHSWTLRKRFSDFDYFYRYRYLSLLTPCCLLTCLLMYALLVLFCCCCLLLLPAAAAAAAAAADDDDDSKLPPEDIIDIPFPGKWHKPTLSMSTLERRRTKLDKFLDTLLFRGREASTQRLFEVHMLWHCWYRF